VPIPREDFVPQRKPVPRHHPLQTCLQSGR
jgi:hypothetical protein